MAFGFVAQFAPSDECDLPWSSITEISKVLRKIGQNLRTIEAFDDGLNGLEKMLDTLNEKDAVNKCRWMTSHNKVTIRDLIFVHCQTICHIFLKHHRVTKSLKTDITNYKRFIQNVCKISSSNTLNLFTKKQIAIFKSFKELIMNYENDCQLSIVEQQHNLLKQKKDEIKQNDFDDQVVIINKLKSSLTKTRIDRCENVLKHRTDRVYLILDQCYDVRNQCAMLRTAELFGIQHVWIVKPVNYKNNKVYDSISRHSQLWLTLRYFNSSLECINALKTEQPQRKIWVMDIGKDAIELSTTTIDEYRNKTRIFPEYLAIVMGKEAEGPTQDFLKYCDQKMFLPQFGFCESYNVSCACAMGLQSIFAMNDGIRGKMDDNYRNKLRYLWYYQLVNDKKIKQEMKELMDKGNDLNDIDDTGNKNKVTNKNEKFDFRRQNFNHWDSKNVNHKFRQKLEKQQKQKFIDTMNTFNET